MTEVQVEVSGLRVDLAAVTELEGTVEQVWAVLTDTGRYGEWNPFVRRFVGAVAIGRTIEVELHTPGRKAQVLRPRIVELREGRSFTWRGTTGVPGVFDGRHRFAVDPLEDGRTRFTQSERLSGLLVPAFRSMLRGPTVEAFTAFNDALAGRVHGVR